MLHNLLTPRFRLCLLIGLLVVFILPLTGATAQAGFKSIGLSDRYEIHVPNDWTAEAEDDGSTALYGNNWAAFVYSPDILAQNVTIPAGADATTVLQTAYTLYFSGRAPQARNVSSIQIDQRTAAFYEEQETIDGEVYDFQLYAIQLSDKAYGTVLLVATHGLFPSVETQADQILASFNVNPSTLRQEVAEARGLTPCLVSTDARDTARLRVGPGENRTSVAFLPTGEEFTVTGRNVDSGGGVWYQLVKEDAAPQSAAAEIWVAADDVDSTGDCDFVGDTAAPPVIAINPGGSVPPATGDTGQPEQPASGGPVNGVVPLGGYYVLVFLSAIADGSCQGGGNVQFPVAEVYSGQTANTLTVLNSGASLRFGTDVWNRAADGSAFYSGNLQFSADSQIPNGVVYLNVVSTTELRGTLVSNWVDGGVACSDTVAVSLRRQ